MWKPQKQPESDLTDMNDRLLIIIIIKYVTLD